MDDRGTIDLLAANMALSLTVEGAFNPVKLARHARAALRRILLILVPTGSGLPCSRRGSSAVRPRLCQHGAPVLVLLAAATLPKTLTEIYLGALRAQSRTSLVALVQGARAVLVLGLTVGLTETMGIVGTGVAVLASQVVIAAVFGPGLVRVLTADRHPQPAEDGAAEDGAAEEAYQSGRGPGP